MQTLFIYIYIIWSVELRILRKNVTVRDIQTVKPVLSSSVINTSLAGDFSKSKQFEDDFSINCARGTLKCTFPVAENLYSYRHVPLNVLKENIRKRWHS